MPKVLEYPKGMGKGELYGGYSQVDNRLLLPWLEKNVELGSGPRAEAHLRKMVVYLGVERMIPRTASAKKPDQKTPAIPHVHEATLETIARRCYWPMGPGGTWRRKLGGTVLRGVLQEMENSGCYLFLPYTQLTKEGMRVAGLRMFRLDACGNGIGPELHRRHIGTKEYVLEGLRAVAREKPGKGMKLYKQVMEEYLDEMAEDE